MSSLKHRVAKLTGQTGTNDARPRGRVFLAPEWEAMSVEEQQAATAGGVAFVLPDNGRDRREPTA